MVLPVWLHETKLYNQQLAVLASYPSSHNFPSLAVCGVWKEATSVCVPLLFTFEVLCKRLVIGGSLCEPHISVTALSMCVYIHLYLFGLITYRKFQMSAFKILIFHDVHTNVYFS